jgi:hypothetical protein
MWEQVVLARVALTEMAKDSWSSKRTKRSVEVRHAVVSC